MNWIDLESAETLNLLLQQSSSLPVLIYKHSTRCSVSSMVQARLERSWAGSELRIFTYFLDLVRFRELSNAIEEQFEVVHESPQVLLIVHGRCIYHTSHMGINFKDIKDAVDGVSA